jgi:periplasmic nitrate reductase NapE
VDRRTRPACRPFRIGGEGQLEDDRTRREESRRETLVFVFLAFVIWPFIAAAIVGGYGFIVWMTQMLTGPPGPV